MAVSFSSISSGKDVSIEDEERLKLWEISTSGCIPNALLCIVKLKVLDILQAANGKMLSAAEIASKMPRCKSPSNLDRILRLLASREILLDSFSKEDGVRRYGLTRICTIFQEKPGFTHMLELLCQFPELWLLLQDAVTDDLVPFRKLKGMGFFEYMTQKDPAVMDVFNAAMFEQSAMVTHAIVKNYGHHFKNVGSLVDVGGSIGTMLAVILAAHPHIKGINFDLPQVIATAPNIPGIKHVGGNMFESIPRADAIFIKNVLHNWSDKDCRIILRNCYEALPSQGKVICVDVILASRVEHAPWAHVSTSLDMYMLAYFEGGRERTKEELTGLAKSVGFIELEVLGQIDYLSLAILHKA